MTLPNNNDIIGVEFKLLKSFPDGRGFFREIIRHTDPFFNNRDSFGQWSHSKMQKDVVKAWHFHHIQTDWWYIPMGQAEVILYDNREESPTYQKKLVFKLGETDVYGSDTYEACVKIPTGVLHACQVLSETAHLFYITSEIYNPQDEGRIAYNSPQIPHKWTCENPITSEKDRVDFIPPHPRKSLVC